MRWYASQPSLEKAVTVAVLSKLPSGKRHPHQCRIPAVVLEQAKGRLLAADLFSCGTFHDLFKTVQREISGIRGAGELFVYDVAHRIGAFLKLEPERVYLHAGTRTGAKRLGLYRGQEYLEPQELPEPLQQLSPAQVEDCLCIYKEMFNKSSNQPLQPSRKAGVQPAECHLMKTKYPINPNEVEKSSNAYHSHEKRDAMYKVATFLVGYYWGKPQEMADALGVLLLTWNNAFYRYGGFNFLELEKTLSKRMSDLETFKERDILSFKDTDVETVKNLFNDFLCCLKIADGKSKGRKSPVAVAKAMHLLAPRFFPLWDDKIAKAYNCSYSVDPTGKYLKFLRISKNMAEQLKDKVQIGAGTSLLKMIDEYNYTKFTKGWI